MSSVSQKTLRSAVQFDGVGLHSGKQARVTIRPALPNRGIVFVRTDLDPAFQVAARWDSVVSTQLATTLGRDQITVSTIEHLMAALAGLGVDNAIVEVDGPEVPILDGSSVLFAEKILESGIVSQSKPKSYLKVLKKIEVKMGEKWALIEPASHLSIQASIEFDHPSVGYQEFRYTEGQTDFLEIASARTFCFLKDVQAMQKMGLIKGGSLENAVVLDHALVLNPEGMRYTDELARHKVLDAIGDFALTGVSLQASIRMHRTGHDLHRRVLEAIYSDSRNYEIVAGIGPARADRVRPSSPLIPAVARSYAIG